MTFIKGQSGNPSGRRKGVLNKRTELAKILDRHAESLVNKLIELALQGEITALRLCIERLIPKAKNESTGIQYQKNIPKLKEEILQAALDGRISIEDAEKLRNLVKDQEVNDTTSLSINTTCPIEAANIYQQLMRKHNS
ncbi:DUF5681 domain-containing protein [Legionella sainthelensi]|uniref:DUF5681 domain-containing protein n=1 Tax=Legionella sainthelensi TaxID=28087 RepID=UPI00157FB178|nr:DUF5681 domain-containing protein [Legionella sainthelensi]